MRILWESNDWNDYLKKDVRTGIRLKFDQNVDPEVQRACKEFVNWLRSEYEFPMRIPIYFKCSKQVKTMDGDTASATFFGPFDKTVEPYIRVSVGDYPDLLEQRGKDNALAAILGSIAHELTHYFQWIKDVNSSDQKNEKQAKYYAGEILLDYAETREHP